jgi:chloramphenicol 3-O phosphotransferase
MVLIVEHIVETEEWMRRLLVTLEDYDVFYVGVHCPHEELERRERLRGNRKMGEARADFEVTHTLGVYDFECSTTESADTLAAQPVAAWLARGSPGAFTAMLRNLDRTNRAA